MEWTQISIGKAPPTAHETKDGFCPQLWNRDIHEYQVTARCEQFVKMPERRAQIAHRVKHIRADDEIERPPLEALLRTRFLEIKNLVFHSGKSCQLLHCAAKKRRRNVTEDVGMQLALEEGQ